MFLNFKNLSDLLKVSHKKRGAFRESTPFKKKTSKMFAKIVFVFE